MTFRDKQESLCRQQEPRYGCMTQTKLPPGKPGRFNLPVSCIQTHPLFVSSDNAARMMKSVWVTHTTPNATELPQPDIDIGNERAKTAREIRRAPVVRTTSSPARTTLRYGDSRRILRGEPLEFVFDRFADAAVIIAKIGQRAEPGHPWRLRVVSASLRGTAPEPAREGFGEEALKRAAAPGGKHLGLPEYGNGRIDCNFHHAIQS